MIKKMYSEHTIDTDECVRQVGGNRFNLVLIASVRVRELRHKHRKLISTNNSAPVTALREIEQGYIGEEYLKRVR